MVENKKETKDIEKPEGDNKNLMYVSLVFRC